MNRLVLCLIIMLSLSTMVMNICCTRTSDESVAMDRAYSLMETYPDSALEVLASIDNSKLGGKSEKARYALLMSMALDKNYIDITTFDIIQPAIDYCLEHGSPNDRLRTLYYQGRIYQNQEDDEKAMISFLSGCDLMDQVTDSLILAHTLVAQAVIYFKQYEIMEYCQNNIMAAQLYGNIGRGILELKSYANAVQGYTMMSDRQTADSLISICLKLDEQLDTDEDYLFSPLLSYMIEFGTSDEIRAFLDQSRNSDIDAEDALDIAYGYSKLGENDLAMDILSSTAIPSSLLDSLKYFSVKVGVLEGKKDLELTVDTYRDFYAMHGRYLKKLLSDDRLFAAQKHKLVKDQYVLLKARDIIIMVISALAVVLFLIIALGYSRYRMVKSKRNILEKEKDRLRLEAENLSYEKKAIERERDSLMDLLKEQSGLNKMMFQTIKKRVSLLNGLLAKEISQKDTSDITCRKQIKLIMSKRDDFMNETRQVFLVSHPKFMNFLESHDLTIEEINLVCLFAIGLKGADAGEYIQLKSHYIISSEIRKKLGLNEHDTNLDTYIRSKMKESDPE